MAGLGNAADRDRSARTYPCQNRHCSPQKAYACDAISYSTGKPVGELGPPVRQHTVTAAAQRSHFPNGPAERGKGSAHRTPQTSRLRTPGRTHRALAVPVACLKRHRLSGPPCRSRSDASWITAGATLQGDHGHGRRALEVHAPAEGPSIRLAGRTWLCVAATPRQKRTAGPSLSKSETGRTRSPNMPPPRKGVCTCA